MYRQLPIFNRPVMQKIIKKNQQLHQRRLQSIKNAASNKTICITHSLNNKRTQVKQEEKKTQIQRQNARLFTRMMKIMKRQDPINKPQQQYSILCRNRNSVYSNRLQQENRSLFERLEQQKPTISNKKLRKQRQKNLTLLKFMGKYPNPLAFKHSSRTQIKRKSYTQAKWNYPNLSTTMQQEDFYRVKKQIQQKTLGKDIYLKTRKFRSEGVERRNKSQESESDIYIKKREGIADRKPGITLYQGYNKINNQQIFMKIIRYMNRYQIILKPPNIDQTILQLSQIQGNQFFAKYDYNYKLICQLLTFENRITNQNSQKVQKFNSINLEQFEDMKNKRIGSSLNICIEGLDQSLE